MHIWKIGAKQTKKIQEQGRQAILDKCKNNKK